VDQIIYSVITAPIRRQYDFGHLRIQIVNFLHVHFLVSSDSACAYRNLCNKWFYMFLQSPRLLVRLLIGLLPPSLHFSISTFSSASFFGSLMILACGNNSFQDICRLRHERHMGVVGLLFCLMLSSISRPLKKGGNTEFL